MLQFTHDPEAGTIYCYFTELEQGQVVESFEYPAALLCDAAGQVLGLRLYLDDDITLAMLELVLDGDFERLDMQTGELSLVIAAEPPAQVVRLDQTALLDLDEDDRVLGVELAVPAEWRTPASLARLEPFLLPLDDLPAAGEGPLVFAPADAPAELEPAASADVPAAALAMRSGFVALVGKPNVGKSTLLNALLGEKVAIVSPRPQTTRVPMRGILSRDDAQIVFVDTPGIHKPNHRLGRFMVDLAERSLPGADVIGFMVDISNPLPSSIGGLPSRCSRPAVLHC
jgi:GTP-binding protein Era